MIAPTTAIPEIALVNDINGVCKSGDTPRINWKPKKAASIKTQRPNSYSPISLPSSTYRGQAQHFVHARVNHFARVRHQSLADDLVLAIHVQRAILPQHHLHERGDVRRVHLAGVERRIRGDVAGAADAAAPVHHGFAGPRSLALAPALGRG